MSAWVNQHSFLLTVAAVFLITAILLLRDGVKMADVLALAALAIGAWGAPALLKPGPSTLTEADAIRAQVGAGRPVVVEFQSPY